MGNSNSMNNLSMIDHKRQTTEFLRYSQIPYESQFRSPNSNSHLNIHEIGKLRSSTNYPPNPNPVKVLPDVKFEPKLRTTNNGAILQSGGTISGRKDSECGLHRSKSISESQNTYLSNPNGTAQPSPPVFKMQRASTQLSINHRAPSKPNLPRHYDDTVKLETVDVKFKKTHDMQKAHRAPQPPITNKNIPYRGNQKEVGPKQHPVNLSQAVPNQNQRLFGDTLTKKMDPRLKTSISASTQNLNNPKIRMQNQAVPLNPIKPNMTSYLRRERTFDMTLMTDVGRKKEEMKPKYSPQFQRKNRQLTTQERYKANVTSQPLPPPQTSTPQTSAISKQRPVCVKSHEKMKTIDRKNVKKKPAETSVEQLFADAKNAKVSNENSTVSNTGNSVSSSFNYLKGPPTQNAQNIVKKQPEIIKSNSPTAYSRESPIRQIQQQQQHHHHQQQQQPQQQQISPNNFFYELKETTVDSIDTNDDKNEVNHAHMDIVNKFAEDILKMSTFDVSQTEVMTESTTSEDYEDMNILLALRPTLPRRQLQIPHFSPLAAWRSIEIDINNLNDSKNSKLSSSSSQLQLINEDTKLETKIEKIYREPSFNLQQLDNKSGDSGISADKEIGNSPDSMQIPQAYLMNSWTPQQDLEEDEESIDGHDMNYQLNGTIEQQQAAANGRMFSLSLPRDNQSSSDKLNNFYSLQKFKKAVVDVYEYSDARIQCHNYGSDNNWLLSSQPNSIDELSSKKEKEKNQIISQMRSGKHIMYLPSHWNDETRQIESHKMIQQSIIQQSNDIENENVNIHYLHKEIEDSHAKKSSSKNRFKFQSTIRQVERRKIAEKLSKEAEEKEMMRLGELEAMQKVEEEFQKKRLREKSRLRHQLRIVSLEESYDGPHYNFRNDIDSSVDTRTPYISKIIEAKSPKKL
ncbi:unnamed protein product [Chironomus riparius]|uniref:Uncharacterized protein n=1 Tax=Chironomus riparius TaxID=315576 RepID=A0A9N9WVE2_9DIPT|nr:unnamed protein product [Chironomus riparius]